MATFCSIWNLPSFLSDQTINKLLNEQNHLREIEGIGNIKITNATISQKKWKNCKPINYPTPLELVD